MPTMYIYYFLAGVVAAGAGAAFAAELSIVEGAITAATVVLLSFAGAADALLAAMAAAFIVAELYSNTDGAAKASLWVATLPLPSTSSGPNSPAAS